MIKKSVNLGKKSEMIAFPVQKSQREQNSEI